MGTPVLKAVPEDFLVHEVPALAAPRAGGGGGRHHHLRLRKRGYTTFEAMDLLARALDLPAEAVSSAGLKDEDGVTEQTVSVDGEAPAALLERLNRDSATEGRWLSFASLGPAERRIEIGELLGNAFRLTLRSIEDGLAEQLRGIPRGETGLAFANYYDTQRFGVPGGPRVTHLIGAALLAEDQETAFALLRTSGSAEGARALAHRGDAREFFAQLDQRVTAFYRTAHSSYLWNEQLAGLLAAAAEPGEAAAVDREGLRYLFPTTARPALAVLADQPELAYEKWRWSEGELRMRVSRRPTVLHTVLTLGPVEPDELHQGRSKCTLSFMLPSGCYATNVVAQFLGRLDQGLQGHQGLQ
ncbi:tRNA pseudouridine 13 synthase [Kitasatospora sp. MMS16-BH015]|uniref:tRNA pseudouridine(13) synthase TruD n=1 Tax=Kitasatospora sp. MMS16-BH015 TaxID=2018025 RepID=UPI000CA3DA66|nr:tRNA pseudouridine(13) synthase TruD [Kitasatospora sp. MMS16-BH015]AUG78263.1 tRNA pseudouridine 13 synthase [Kitasatospora sp. MMS16-BH015]